MEEGWLWLASHLKKGLQEVKRITTSSEFVLWMVYREHLNNDFHREDYYLAQICACIAGLFTKGVKVSDFLLKFKTREEVEEETEREEEENYWNEETAAAATKGMVFASLGMDPVTLEDNNVPPEPG